MSHIHPEAAPEHTCPVYSGCARARFDHVYVQPRRIDIDPSSSVPPAVPVAVVSDARRTALRLRAAIACVPAEVTSIGTIVNAVGLQAAWEQPQRVDEWCIRQWEARTELAHRRRE